MFNIASNIYRNNHKKRIIYTLYKNGIEHESGKKERKIMGAVARLRATAPTVYHTDLTILTIRLL